jgi:hypothetical protein
MAAAKDSTALARLHFDTAVALVGAEKVREWIATATGVTATGPTPAVTGGGRGRKPGTVAAADERCTWTLHDGTQCKNRHQSDSTYCKIHLKQVHLVDDATA